MSRHDEREGVKMTDEQIAEGLRLAGEVDLANWSPAMVGINCTVNNYVAATGPWSRPGQNRVFTEVAMLRHMATHYAAALREVQALRQQVKDALACIEPRCVEEREVIQGYVTRDMAADAGEPMMEGEAVMGVETIEHEEWIELAAILRGDR